MVIYKKKGISPVSLYNMLRSLGEVDIDAEIQSIIIKKNNLLIEQIRGLVDPKSLIPILASIYQITEGDQVFVIIRNEEYKAVSINGPSYLTLNLSNPLQGETEIYNDIFIPVDKIPENLQEENQAEIDPKTFGFAIKILYETRAVNRLAGDINNQFLSRSIEHIIERELANNPFRFILIQSAVVKKKIILPFAHLWDERDGILFAPGQTELKGWKKIICSLCDGEGMTMRGNQCLKCEGNGYTRAYIKLQENKKKCKLIGKGRNVTNKKKRIYAIYKEFKGINPTIEMVKSIFTIDMETMNNPETETMGQFVHIAQNSFLGTKKGDTYLLLDNQDGINKEIGKYTFHKTETAFYTPNQGLKFTLSKQALSTIVLNYEQYIKVFQAERRPYEIISE